MIRKIIVSGILALALCSCKDQELGYVEEYPFRAAQLQPLTQRFPLHFTPIDKKDSIRSDRAVMNNFWLGAYQDPIFGKRTASLASQARLTVLNPKFELTARVDSVVLMIRPAITPKNKKEIQTRAIRYGVQEGSINLVVHALSEALPNGTLLYSNHPVKVGQELGKTTFSGELKNEKDFISVKLDPDFFQQKLLKAPLETLDTNQSFVEHFPGIYLTTDNANYMLNIPENGMNLRVYYSYQTPAGVAEHRSYDCVVGISELPNLTVALYHYQREGTSFDAEKGNTAQLYLQGMGGASIQVDLSDEVLATLKRNFKQNKRLIASAVLQFKEKEHSPISAYFGLMTMRDHAHWLPYYSNAAYELFLGRALRVDFKEKTVEVPLTRYLRGVVESGQKSEPFILEIGNMEAVKDGRGQVHVIGTSRSYAPESMVLVGNDGSEQVPTLEVTYVQ